MAAKELAILKARRLNVGKADLEVDRREL